MEALCLFKTLDSLLTTRRYNTEDRTGLLFTEALVRATY
jgi:hypothetical protein